MKKIKHRKPPKTKHRKRQSQKNGHRAPQSMTFMLKATWEAPDGEKETRFTLARPKPDKALLEEMQQRATANGTTVQEESMLDVQAAMYQQLHAQRPSYKLELEVFDADQYTPET